MPWELNGNAGIGANNFLGTRNNAPLIIKTNTDTAPANLEEVIRVTPSSAAARGSVGIGTATPRRRLHVEDTEIHRGGGAAGHSFGNRETAAFVQNPAAGERWVWYASGGRARLWSGTDKLMVTPGGEVAIGTAAPQRRLHVEGSEIHSGGGAGGFSFGNRETADPFASSTAGDRWVWYASGRIARLWSLGDKLTVTADGDIALSGKHAFRSSDPWLRLNQDGAFPAGVHTPGLFAPGSLNVGGVGGWGNPGFGNAVIAGRLATNGLDTTNNSPAATTGPGFPSWSGGGVNTFDVIVRGGLYAGLNLENPAVQITAAGTVSATVKNFRINHPLDPEHCFLIHACLEGPENAVYYRGQGRLEGGHARVELPYYFEALARRDGRTVILTPCCEESEPISVLAASGIVNGAFNVRAADDRNPQQPFYWEVKAVRADVEPLETEERKGEGKSAAARRLGVGRPRERATEP
jgi:hypothetical protein